MDREKTIVRTGMIGVLANVLLAAFKAVIGILAGSIAITLDAVNNLTDVLSSVITIISTKLAGRQPDKKHPYGHGRIEYLSTVTIAIIILYAGITSLVESIKKIITPQTPEYTPVALIIIAVAVAVKIVLGLYVRSTGERSGKDALLDAVISTSTLVAAGIFLIWGISLEAWLAAIISLIIIQSGFGMLRESISSILGERVEGDVARAVRQTVLAFPDVSGVYDLILHNYGPDILTGSVHIELPEEFTVRQLDVLERRITETVYEKTGVALTGISVYARGVNTPFSASVFADLRDIIAAHSSVLQVHGFSVDENANEIRFDIVIDFNAKNREEIFQDIVDNMIKKYPTYHICPVLDADTSDV